MNVWREAWPCLLHSIPNQPSPGRSKVTRPLGAAVFFITHLLSDQSQLIPRAPESQGQFQGTGVQGRRAGEEEMGFQSVLSQKTLCICRVLLEQLLLPSPFLPSEPPILASQTRQLQRPPQICLLQIRGCSGLHGAGPNSPSAVWSHAPLPALWLLWACATLGLTELDSHPRRGSRGARAPTSQVFCFIIALTSCR